MVVRIYYWCTYMYYTTYTYYIYIGCTYQKTGSVPSEWFASVNLIQVSTNCYPECVIICMVS